MDVIAGLRGHLAGASALVTLVPIARIYSPTLEAKAFSNPANAGPAIQLQNVSAIDIDAHNRGPGGTHKDRIQVDCWALTQDLAKTIAKICRARMNGYQGIWIGTGSPPPTMRVARIEFIIGSERFDGDEIGGGLGHQGADYFITYKDSEEQVLI